MLDLDVDLDAATAAREFQAGTLGEPGRHRPDHSESSTPFSAPSGSRRRRSPASIAGSTISRASTSALMYQHQVGNSAMPVPTPGYSMKASKATSVHSAFGLLPNERSEDDEQSPTSLPPPPRRPRVERGEQVEQAQSPKSTAQELSEPRAFDPAALAALNGVPRLAPLQLPTRPTFSSRSSPRTPKAHRPATLKLATSTSPPVAGRRRRSTAAFHTPTASPRPYKVAGEVGVDRALDSLMHSLRIAASGTQSPGLPTAASQEPQSRWSSSTSSTEDAEAREEIRRASITSINSWLSGVESNATVTPHPRSRSGSALSVRSLKSFRSTKSTASTRSIKSGKVGRTKHKQIEEWLGMDDDMPPLPTSRSATPSTPGGRSIVKVKGLFKRLTPSIRQRGSEPPSPDPWTNDLPDEHQTTGGDLSRTTSRSTHFSSPSKKLSTATLRTLGRRSSRPSTPFGSISTTASARRPPLPLHAAERARSERGSEPTSGYTTPRHQFSLSPALAAVSQVATADVPPLPGAPRSLGTASGAGSRPASPPLASAHGSPKSPPTTWSRGSKLAGGALVVPSDMHGGEDCIPTHTSERARQPLPMVFGHGHSRSVSPAPSHYRYESVRGPSRGPSPHSSRPTSPQPDKGKSRARRERSPLRRLSNTSISRPTLISTTCAALMDRFPGPSQLSGSNSLETNSNMSDGEYVFVASPLRRPLEVHDEEHLMDAAPIPKSRIPPPASTAEDVPTLPNHPFSPCPSSTSMAPESHTDDWHPIPKSHSFSGSMLTVEAAASSFFSDEEEDEDEEVITFGTPQKTRRISLGSRSQSFVPDLIETLPSPTGYNPCYNPLRRSSTTPDFTEALKAKHPEFWQTDRSSGLATTASLFSDTDMPHTPESPNDTVMRGRAIRAAAVAAATDPALKPRRLLQLLPRHHSRHRSAVLEKRESKLLPITSPGSQSMFKIPLPPADSGVTAPITHGISDPIISSGISDPIIPSGISDPIIPAATPLGSPTRSVFGFGQTAAERLPAHLSRSSESYAVLPRVESSDTLDSVSSEAAAAWPPWQWDGSKGLQGIVDGNGSTVYMARDRNASVHTFGGASDHDHHSRPSVSSSLSRESDNAELDAALQELDFSRPRGAEDGGATVLAARPESLELEGR